MGDGVRKTTMAIAAGLLLGANACGTEESAASSPSSSSAASTTSETPEPTPSPTPTPTVRKVAPAPLFIGGSEGLEELHSTALEVAGEEAWGHVVAVERIRDVVLMLRTDWTTATVNQEQANLICAGVYTWMRDASGYGSAPGVTSQPFQAVSLYENTPPGEQVFAC